MGEDVLQLLLGPIAGWRNDAEIVATLHRKETNGWYPLYRACWNGKTSCAKLLIDARASVEGLKSGRYSPLIAAARWGHESTVAALLEARADPVFKNVVGEDAMSLASSQRHQGVMRVLQNALQIQGVHVDDAESEKIATRHTLGQGWWNLGSEFYSNGEEPPQAVPFLRVG